MKAEKSFPPSAREAVIREFSSESIRRKEISSTADAHLWRRNSVNSIRYRLSNPREDFTPSDVIKVTLVRRGGIRSVVISENTSLHAWWKQDLDSDQLDLAKKISSMKNKIVTRFCFRILRFQSNQIPKRLPCEDPYNSFTWRTSLPVIPGLP